MSKQGMLGFRLADVKQMIGYLTGQLRAFCTLCCMLAFASGRTCHSGQNGMCMLTGFAGCMLVDMTRSWFEYVTKGMCENMSDVMCRYGMSYISHRLPAVASIMITQEYSQFAQQVWSSHIKANKQAELDVSASMGDMLQDMQACLKQLCGSAAVGEPEAVARLIAENISAMNISSDAAHVQEDSLEEVLALPSTVAVSKPDSLSQVTSPASGTKRFRASLIQAPSLYDTSGSINSIALAWQEWTSGPAQTTISQRVLEIKAHMHMSLGRRNTNLHKKNRHLPQLIESLISYGASAGQAVSLMTIIAGHFQLSLDQVREGSRLIAGKTAKSDSDSLTAESAVTLGDFKAAVGWAYAQAALMQVKPDEQDACALVSQAEALMCEHTSHSFDCLDCFALWLLTACQNSVLSGSFINRRI